MDTLLPVLEPFDWPRRDDCSCRPLLDGVRATGLPLVALSQQLEPLLVYLTPARLEKLGIGRDAAEARALDNLGRITAEWTVVQSATPTGAWLELHVHQGPMAAERILDHSELARLSTDRIGDDSAALAIPRRGLLLATSTTSALDGAFPRVVRGLFEEAVEAVDSALSPHVYVAERGRLVGLLS